MIQSEPVFKRDRTEETQDRPARSIVGVFQILGAFIVAVFAGSGRAGKVMVFETVLGASVVGALGALLVGAGRSILGGQHMYVLDALEIGAGVGACLGAALHLFTQAVEDHAKAKEHNRFGDN